jgi:uridine kinase
VPLGALLIQSDPHTGEPLLLNMSLPQSLHSGHTAKNAQVLLLDSQMGTGAAAREYSTSHRIQNERR